MKKFCDHRREGSSIQWYTNLNSFLWVLTSQFTSTYMLSDLLVGLVMNKFTRNKAKFLLLVNPHLSGPCKAVQLYLQSGVQKCPVPCNHGSLIIPGQFSPDSQTK